MLSKTEFGVCYDSTAKVVTALVSALLLLTAVVTREPTVIVLSLLIFVIGFEYSPSGYTVEGRDVVVRRRIGRVRISGVSEVRRARAEDFAWTVRLFASGGLFGYYGLFHTSKLGNAWWYVTDGSNAVVLTPHGKPVLVSPDATELFLGTMNAPASAGSPQDRMASGSNT